MKYIYALLLIVSSYQLHAQRNFKPGYIVSLNGDTIKGLIDYKDWNQNPRNISFRSNLDQLEKSYSASNINSFGIDGLDEYIRYQGPVSMGLVELSTLSTSIDSSFVNDTVFLRVIAKGDRLSLYSFTDSRKTRSFVAETNSVPSELIRYVFIDSQEADKVREVNTYKQQLIKLALKYQPGNNTLIDKIQRVSYITEQLENLLFDIDGKKPGTNNKVPQRSGIRFFAGAGVNASKLTFTYYNEPINGGSKNIMQAGDSFWSALPAISGGFDFLFNKNVGRLFLRTEASLAFNKHRASYSEVSVKGVIATPHKEHFNFDQLLLSVSPQLTYNIVNYESLKFYVAGGMQAAVAFYSNRLYQLDYFSNDAMNDDQLIGTASFNYDVSYQRFFVSPTAKAGVIINNRLNIFAGYIPPVKIISEHYFTANLSAYQIGLLYLFDKN